MHPSLYTSVCVVMSGNAPLGDIVSKGDEIGRESWNGPTLPFLKGVYIHKIEITAPTHIMHFFLL